VIMWKQTVFCGILILSLLDLILPMAGFTNTQAGSSAIEGPLIYTSDRAVYTEGEVVRITVTKEVGGRSLII